MGNLIADGIGLVGDRVRRKRELNASLGLGAVREKLEVDGIDLQRITPPEEEELHLLMNGMSLAGDEGVRNMWAGLFAKALDPDSKISAERPFIRVLENLSPMDAKIVAFLAFAQKTDAELRRDVASMRPTKIQDALSEEAQQFNSKLVEARRSAVASIVAKAKEYGIDALNGSAWSENLLRLGVISKIQARSARATDFDIRSLSERDLLPAMYQLSKLVEGLQKAASDTSTPPKRVVSNLDLGSQIQLEIEFTPFGVRLARACGLL